MKYLMVALALATAVAEAGSFTLVENGKAKPVVIPADAEESTKLAATEWTNYVTKATGVALEVKSKSEKVKSNFFIRFPSEARSENGHFVGLSRIPVQVVLVELVEQGLSAPMSLRASAPDYNQNQDDANI